MVRQGARSCAHWLSWRVGWNLVTAREHVRVARKLGEFSATDEALRCGEISYSKVRAIVRVATRANEAMLLETARFSTGEELEKLARKYATVQAYCNGSTPRDDLQRRYVRKRDTQDGMVKIEAVLHPEEAELVWAALGHGAKQLLRTAPDVSSSTPADGRPDGGDGRCCADPVNSTSHRYDDSAESLVTRVAGHSMAVAGDEASAL